MSGYTTYQFLSSRFSKRGTLKFIFYFMFSFFYCWIELFWTTDKKRTNTLWYREQNIGAWNFSFRVQLDISRVSTGNELDIELNMRREIRYLRATVYYFVHYGNNLLTTRSRVHSRFQKKRRCHSNGGVTCGQLISNTHVKFTCGGAVFLSGVNPFKDGAYYCYCAYVLRISRYSDFLLSMLTNTGIFLRGLKLSGESRS